MALPAVLDMALNVVPETPPRRRGKDDSWRHQGGRKLPVPLIVKVLRRPGDGRLKMYGHCSLSCYKWQENTLTWKLHLDHCPETPEMLST